MAQRANIIQFPGTGKSSSKVQQGTTLWYSRILKFCAAFVLALIRRFLTFWVLVFATVGNTLFAIGTGITQFVFRMISILALVLGLGYAFFVWLFVVVGKTHADPHIWQYLGRFEIGMLMLLTIGIALELASTMGRGWIYAQIKKARPLIDWGLK